MNWVNEMKKYFSENSVYPIDMGGKCSAFLATREMQINHKEEWKQAKGMELERALCYMK